MPLLDPGTELDHLTGGVAFGREVQPIPGDLQGGGERNKYSTSLFLFSQCLSLSKPIGNWEGPPQGDGRCTRGQRVTLALLKPLVMSHWLILAKASHMTEPKSRGRKVPSSQRDGEIARLHVKNWSQ